MKQSGFTLIEALAAMVMVAIGLVSVLGMFAYGSRATVLQQDRLLAMSMLQRAVKRREPRRSKILQSLCQCRPDPHLMRNTRRCLVIP